MGNVTYFLDTDVCVDLLRGRASRSLDFFMRFSRNEVKLPALVEAELRLGAQKGKSRKNKQMVEAFLEPFEIVPFDSGSAAVYANIRAELEESGRRIGPNDLIIAATTVASNATLITNNIREYKRVSGLKVVLFEDVKL